MKIFFTISFFVLIFSQLTEAAIDCELLKKSAVDDLPFEITYHYQQKNPSTKDLMGDVALMRLVHAMPKNLWWILRKKNELLESQQAEISSYKNCAKEIFSLESDDPELITNDATEKEMKEEDQNRINQSTLSLPDKARILELFKESAFVIEGDVPPFYPLKLANMFNRVIQEEAQKGIPPEVGVFHQWSKGFIRKHYLKYFPFTLMSKVLLALARGETSRFMITGQEKNLKSWILEQAEDSISLDKMFRTSYQLNQGNVYQSLLTIENVLAQNWRANNRTELPLTKRLKHFTNTLGKDDRFGNWYHLFGIMLYGYVKNNLNAKLVGTLEGVGSDLLQTDKENQENIINRKGGRTGVLLHRWLKKGTWSKRESQEDFLSEKYYLHHQIDYDRSLKKRLKKINSGNSF